MGIPRNVAAVIGACLVTTRDVYEMVDGFDERFSLWYNDIDYCMHLRAIGFRVMQASDVKLTHFESKTISKIETKIKSTLNKNERQLFKEKWRNYFNRQFVSSDDHLLMGTRILNL